MLKDIDITNCNQAEIAGSIQHLNQYYELYQIREKLQQEEVASEALSESAKKRLEQQREFWDGVDRLAWSNFFVAQFVPDCNLETPVEILLLAYSVFREQNEIEQFTERHPKSIQHIYHINTLIMNPDKRPAYIDGLLDYHWLCHAELPENEKIRRINQIARRYKPIARDVSARGYGSLGDYYLRNGSL